MRTRSSPACRPPVLAVSVIVFAAAFVVRGQTGTDTPGDVWTTSGPTGGGAVLSLAVDSANPSTLFAGTELGVFRSPDGGASWQAAAPSPTGAFTLLVDPTNGRNLFAASPEGVFHSTDGGAHFSLSFSSTFSGATIARSRSIRRILRCSTRPTAHPGAQLFETTNAGVSWQMLGIPILTKAIASLVIDRESPPNVYVGADWDTSYYPLLTAVYRVPESGTNATTILERDEGPWIDRVRSIAVDPASNEVLYVATAKANKPSFYRGEGAVFRSADAGKTWTFTRLPFGADAFSLAIDPASSTTLYVGTDKGVFRSVDAGADWVLLDEGLADRNVNALAIDPTGAVLHAATGSGVFEIHPQPPVSTAPCVPDGRTLCLLDRRFAASLRAQDPRTGQFTSGTPASETDGFGFFSLPDFTGDATLPEVLVKIVDASTPPWKSFWVFHTGLTDVTYLLTVRDTSTGEIRSYFNTPYDTFCGGGDTSAFPAGGASAGATPAGARASLSASGDALALLSGRFRLTLSATDPRTGKSTSGAAIPREDRFGYFSLPAFTGDSELPEVFVKMLDGTTISQTFWLFFGGLTDVDYALTLTDTVSGATRLYLSPGGFCGLADTGIVSIGTSAVTMTRNETFAIVMNSPRVSRP